MVVETVDYQQWETGNFPPPATPESVGARVLMQRRVESNPPARGGVSKTKTTDEGESLNRLFCCCSKKDLVHNIGVRLQLTRNGRKSKHYRVGQKRFSYVA